MNRSLDVLIVVAAVALGVLVSFRAGMGWSNRVARKRITWEGVFEDGRLVGVRQVSPCSSPSADGVPGDNPAGVSIPPTTVPPAGATKPRWMDAPPGNISAAADFFPQYRGR